MIKDKLYQHRLDEWQKRADEHQSSGKWNASLLGSCMRKQFFKRKGEEITDKPTIEAIGKMNMGRYTEDKLMEELKEAGFKVKWEQEEIEFGEVVGKIDACIDDKIAEIKSQQSRAFWHGKKNGSLLKRAHKFQLGVYLMAKNKKVGEVIYISKDDGTMGEVEVELTPELEKEIQERIDKLDGYWLRDELPPAVPDEGWECSYCPYLKKCRG